MSSMESGRAASSRDEHVVTVGNNGKESSDAKSPAATQGNSQVPTTLLKAPNIPECIRKKILTKMIFFPFLAPTDSVVRRRSSGISAYSKSIETSVEEKSQALTSSSTSRSDNAKTEPMTPRKPSTTDEEEQKERKKEESVFEAFNLVQEEKRHKRLKLVLMEWTVFVCVMVWLIATLTIHRLKHTTIWNLEIWKWSVLLAAILCGRLVADLLINIPAALNKDRFLFGHKVLYFVNGLEKSMVALIWLGLILVSWGVLIEEGVERLRNRKRIVNHVTRALAACIVGAGLWLAKDLLVLILASSSHAARFYDRIRKSVFDQHLLTKFSNSDYKSSSGGEKKGFVCEKVGMMEAIKGKRLYTEWSPVLFDEEDMTEAADKIFEKVAKTDPEYILEDDLRRYMTDEDVQNAIPLFQGATDSGKIKKSSFRKWAVDAYNDRKSLGNTLKSTKTAVDELDRILTVLTVIAVILVWVLLMGLVTTKVIVFISSQLLLVTFMFGNTCKTIFESIIFVFVMHPFDLDDRCSIDGVQMVVEEMKLLTTLFLRYDGEMIIYPNSVLTTKPISNFYRSPPMGDSVEFAIDFSTSTETLDALKERIKGYLESKPHRWNKDHSVLVKDIVNVNQMNIGVYVTHTINFQNPGRKNIRRSDLLLELKKIFEELHIKYHLLPQEIHLKSIDSSMPAFPATRR